MLAAAAKPAPPKRLSPEARAAVQAYAWPGNVRELKNAMDRATVVSLGDTIALEDLPERMLRAVGRDAAPGASADGPTSAPTSGATADGDATLDLRTRLARFEASVIAEALRAAGGRQARAAELLGLPLRTLKYKLRALGVRHPASG
jgi:DNA-binding NtrC family response regulator